ncbi:chemotaxis protein CheC [Salinarchaeum laminariae]|uniref:chemotaxis protein CheC n=1 Tax=Salinarchaeum laminariae TaxID=869888 RepID=UPI0020C0426A|nr:chemotaxis protein CheC [Salinarchaeum laminariae]
MRLDTTALGTFHEMAREGAGIAAGRLTGIAEVEARVGITKLNFVRGNEIRKELAAGGEKVAVRVELSGAIEGHSMVVFDADSARRVLETLLGEEFDDTAPAVADGEDAAVDATGTDAGADAAAPAEFDELSQSAMEEVGQIINSGFVDGWADVLETAIDMTTPQFVQGTDPEPFLDGIDTTPGEEDMAIMFRSQIEAVGEAIGFTHYLFPDHDDFADLLDRLRETEGIEYDKLVGFDRMAQRGAEEVADNISTMTGFDTEIELRRLNFVPMAAIPQELGNRQLIAVAFEFEGTPSGYLVFCFEEESAATVVEGMLPSAPDDAFGEMGQSAIKELSNIMASGFLDGWANVLDTNIDHTPPEYSHDLGAAVMDPIVLQFGDSQEFAFVFDTHVQAAERGFDVEIYAIPDEDDLERALSQLDVDRIDDEPIEADFPIDEA